MSDIKATPQELGLQVETNLSRTRETVDNSTGAMFKRGIYKTANAVGTAANLAAPIIPGGAVLSQAISNIGAVGKSVQSTGSASSTYNAGGVGGTTVFTGGNAGGVNFTGGGGAGSAFDAVAQNAAAGDTSSQTMMATRELTEMQQNFNLQYLQLQTKVQGDNRQYTALTNICKSRHDACKAAVSNMR